MIIGRLAYMEQWAQRIKDRLDTTPGLTMSGLAKACGIKPPSLFQWFNSVGDKPSTRMLSGENLVAAAIYTGLDPVEIMTGRKTAAQPMRLTGDMLAGSYRMARSAVKAAGMHDFDPETEPEDAALLALAIGDIFENGLTTVSDSDVLDFVIRVGGLKHAGRSGRDDGAVGGSAGAKEAGTTAPPSRRRRVG